MGEMRLAWRADSPFPRRATRHNDALARFEAPQRRLRLAGNSNRSEHEAEGGGCRGWQKGK
jgi:hypothetical protein